MEEGVRSQDEVRLREWALRWLAHEYVALAAKIMHKAREKPFSYSLSRAEAAADILWMDLKQLESELRRLAAERGGCLSCRYSAPNPDHLSLASRICKLGLSPEGCNRWKPLI